MILVSDLSCPVMVKQDTSLKACFAAAVAAFIKREKRGYQTKLARQVGISRQQLNDILAQRTYAKDELKDQIAHALGYDVFEIIQIGKHLIVTGQFFPYASGAGHYPEHSAERATWIYRKVAEDYHFGAPGVITIRDNEHHDLPATQKYLDGDISDAELYESAVKFFEAALAYYL